MAMLDTETEIKSLWRALDGNIEELTNRLDALEQTVKANDEKRHFGEGELRGYNQNLERSIARIEARLRPEIPVVTPLARSDGNGRRDLGNLAVEPTRATRLRCDDCRVTWTGCAAISDCPECGASVDWVASDYDEGAENERLIIAPAPDYRIADTSEGAPDDGPCGCDETVGLQRQLAAAKAQLNATDADRAESISLREEVRLLRAELGSASLELKQMAGRVEEAEQYAAACEKTAALNQKENVRLKTELVESKAVRKTLEQRVCNQRLVGAAMHKQLAAANTLLAQLRATAAEAYGLPNRAALREHAWRYLDFMRDVLAKGPAEQGEAPATPARSEEQEKSCPYAACHQTGECIYPERAISLGCPDEFTAPSLGQPGADEALERLERLRAEASDA